MKKIWIIGILAVLVGACSTGKQVTKTSPIIKPEVKDTTEYELVIIDPFFDHWYLLNYTPAKDRSDEYYHSQNLFAVARWNEYYDTGQHTNVVDSYIDYRPEVNYGIELNRKLYWYFKYVTKEYGIPLLLNNQAP